MTNTLHRLRKSSDLRRLVEPLAERHGLPAETVKALLVDAFAGIRTLVHSNGRAQFHGFGVFKMKTTAPKVGRNPHTGEQIAIPERTHLNFVEQRLDRNLGTHEPQATPPDPVNRFP